MRSQHAVQRHSAELMHFIPTFLFLIVMKGAVHFLPRFDPERILSLSSCHENGSGGHLVNYLAQIVSVILAMLCVFASTALTMGKSRNESNMARFRMMLCMPGPGVFPLRAAKIISAKNPKRADQVQKPKKRSTKKRNHLPAPLTRIFTQKQTSPLTNNLWAYSPFILLK